MIDPVEFLARNGGMLVLGITCVLAPALAAAAAHRSPAHRRRLGELAVLGAIIWLVLACVPLPRWRLPSPAVDGSPGPGIEPAAELLPASPGELAAIELPPAILDRILRPAAAPPPASLPAAIDWPRAASALYLAGAMAFLAWLVLGQAMLIRIRRSARPPAPWLEELFAALPSRGRRPRLLASSRARRPITFGLWRPAVLLPDACCTPENAPRLRHILLHELAHVEQGDARGHLLFNIAFPILYFHPFYWLLRRQVEFSRELLADERAASFSSRELYASELIGWARGRRSLPAALPGVSGMLRTRSQFYRRMHMLIHRDRPLAVRPSRWWQATSIAAAALAVAATASFLGDRPIEAQEAVESKPLPPIRPPGEEGDRALEASIVETRRKLAELEAKLQALLERQGKTQPPPQPIAADKRRVGIIDSDGKRREVFQILERSRDPQTGEERLTIRREEIPEPPPPDKGGSEPWTTRPRRSFLNQVDQTPYQAKDHLAASPAQAPAAVQLDLVNLAATLAEESGKLETARNRLERLAALVQQNVGSQDDFALAKVEVRVSERKLLMLRRIAEAALRAAESELKAIEEEQEALKTLVQSGQVPVIRQWELERHRAAAQANVEILRSILEESR